MSAHPLPIPSRRARVALGRAALYAFLARALAYPTEAQRAVLDDTLRILERLRTDDAVVADLIAAAAAGNEAPVEDLRSAHRLLFPPVGTSEIAVYEVLYRTRDVFQEAEILADITGFYRAHGLVVGALERERPDHLAVELEFMAFLARKRAYALAELGRARSRECTAAESAFLRDHLGAWGALAGERLARASHPFYAAVGSLLAVWLPLDLAAHSVTPVILTPPSSPADEAPEREGDDACPLDVVLS